MALVRTCLESLMRCVASRCFVLSFGFTLSRLCVTQVVLAVIKGARGKARTSADALKRALLELFSRRRLFPKGIYAEMDSVQTCALRYGIALKKLVPCPAYAHSCSEKDSRKTWNS